MPDVSSIAPAEVRTWIVFDVHKNSLVAGVLPAAGGSPEVTRLENTERSVRRFLDRLGDPERLAVAYEAVFPAAMTSSACCRGSASPAT
jgi:hypothetical protein